MATNPAVWGLILRQFNQKGILRNVVLLMHIWAMNAWDSYAESYDIQGVCSQKRFVRGKTFLQTVHKSEAWQNMT